MLVPESEVMYHSTRRRRSLHVAASALVALVVAIAPSLLLFFGIHLFIRLDVEVVFLCLSLALGGFVFTALERTQPVWRHAQAPALTAWESNTGHLVSTRTASSADSE